MNQQDFMENLRYELQRRSHVDQDDILANHLEFFRIGIEEGRTEEEIAASLGSPRSIARYYKAHQMIRLAETESSIHNIIHAVIAFLSLGAFNLVLVLGPFLGIAGAMVSLLTAGAAVSIGGVLLFAGVLLNLIEPGSINIPVALYSDGLTAAASMSMAVGFTALGLLFLIGDYYLGRIFYRGTLRHLNFHLRLPGRRIRNAQ